MFQPLKLREMEVKNRVVVSPMCMYSANEGVPGDFHLVHYGSRAIGGAGLIFTEMTCVGRDARITPGCAGLVERRAGGRLDAHRRFRPRQFRGQNLPAAWPCRPQGRDQADVGRHGPAAGTGRLGYPVGVAGSLFSRQPGAARDGPRRDGRVKDEFVAARPRAGRRCGFDMLELHCAHGYLLASFISPLTNQRTDAYGGSLANRLRFPLEMFEAMRAVWPSHKPMSVRISATDWAEGGITGDDAVAIARAFAEAGVDLVDVSTGQTVRDAQPVYGRMFQTPFSDQVRNEARVATMCVGNITTSDQVNTILAAGRADLVALGRPHLVDPSFTIRAAAWYGASDIACPPQYQPGKEQIFRNSVRDRQDLDDLKIKAKPRTRAELKADATKPLAAE
jgi:anthraniloyl-CoA monooxygenase